GPVLYHTCSSVCENCRMALLNGNVPWNAFAKGLLIGEVPDVLKDLTWVEQLLVSKVRQSLCYTTSCSGLKKMKAHLIALEAPVLKVYEMLPPPKEDMNKVLAILFTGPAQPTPKDLRWLPPLVCRNAVKRALEWLKLNHIGYLDIIIPDDNLNHYPVEIVYCKSLDLAETADPASHSVEDKKGVDDGICPFVVHCISGNKMTTKSTHELKGIVVCHWQSNGKALGIGHSAQPKSYSMVYLDMFPWLFLYGMGGLGANMCIMSVSTQEKHLFMYHDKWF
ncbi:hypothetical protein J132_06424, partial [Termitomyces sp. J132]